MNIQILHPHCSVPSRHRGLLSFIPQVLLYWFFPSLGCPPGPGLTQPAPTWPCACALCARARLPRSSTHCGCCRASVPQPRSRPLTGPWSYWCCFLYKIRIEKMVKKTVAPAFGKHGLAQPEDVSPHYPAMPPRPSPPGHL